MTKLKCNVTTCASNKNNACCQPSIQVQGASACSSCDTRCQSFIPKGCECSNHTHFCQPNDSLEVNCTAEHCIHNNHGACTAEEVAIRGESANEMCETKCSSFRKK